MSDGVIGLVGSTHDDPYWVTWWSPDPRPVMIEKSTLAAISGNSYGVAVSGRQPTIHFSGSPRNAVRAVSRAGSPTLC